MRKILINNLAIANNLPFVLIAGPCQTESLDHSLMIAKNVSEICQRLNIGFIYKSSLFLSSSLFSLSDELFNYTFTCDLLY